MRRTTSAWTTVALGGVITASLVYIPQSSPAADPPRSGTSALEGGTSDTGTESDPLSSVPAQRGARYLMRNGLDYLKYQQYERALAFLREAEARQKELNEPEKRLLKQGLDRAREGLRLASNAQSPYALSEQSKRRNGFVPARTDVGQSSDAIKTTAAPAASKAKRRPARSESADIELTRGDAEEPIQLTSTEVASEITPTSADSTNTGGTAPGRGGKLPRIPKLTAVPSAPEVSSGPVQGSVGDAVSEPAPLELAMARPPAELPAATVPVIEDSPAPAVIQPTQNVAVPATVNPPVSAAASTPAASPAQERSAAQAQPSGPATASAETPLLILDNDPTPATSTVATGPASAANRADAGAPVSPDPSPLLLLPGASAVPPAAPSPGTQTGTAPAASDGLTLSAPPAGAEVPAVVGEPGPATSSAAPAAPEPLISKPPIVSLEATTTTASPALDPAAPAVAASPGRASDAGAMRVTNAPPEAVYAPANEGLPPLPDELSRAAEPPAIQTAPPVVTAAPAETAAPAAAPLDDALPPLPVELGRPVPLAGELPVRPIGMPPSVAPALSDAQPTSARADTPIAVDASAALAGTRQPTAVSAPVATDAASLPDLPQPTAATAGAMPAAAVSLPVAEPEPSAAQAQTPVTAAPEVTQGTSAAPAMTASAPAPSADSPSLPAAGASSAPGQSTSTDPFLPERKAEGSKLKPHLLHEVAEVARRQEDELHNQVAAPAPQPPSGRETSTSELKTQFQLDIIWTPSPAEARPIKAIPVPEDWVPLGQRNWAPQRKYWAAAATCHLPLYFQDPVLERYGHNVEQFAGPLAKYLSYPVDDPRQSTQNNQIIQPFFSAGLMALQIVALPYNLVMDPPWEAQYDLGYYRPGDVIPTDTYWLPLHGYGPPLRGNNY